MAFLERNDRMWASNWRKEDAVVQVSKTFLFAKDQTIASKPFANDNYIRDTTPVTHGRGKKM